MAEEVKPGTTGQNNPAPAASGANNNPTNPAGGSGSQGGSPQVVPYDRFKEVNDAKVAAEARIKELEGKAPTSPSSATGGDEAWKRKIELEISIPDYLKDKTEEILDYWGKYPNMPKSDVYKVFTPAEKFAEMINQTNDQANQSRTGGTSNPAARQIDNKPLTQWEQKDLKSELEARMAAGEKI
jgi:hypothetical protein